MIDFPSKDNVRIVEPHFELNFEILRNPEWNGVVGKGELFVPTSMGLLIVGKDNITFTEHNFSFNTDTKEDYRQRLFDNA